MVFIGNHTNCPIAAKNASSLMLSKNDTVVFHVYFEGIANLNVEVPP